MSIKEQMEFLMKLQEERSMSNIEAAQDDLESIEEVKKRMVAE